MDVTGSVVVCRRVRRREPFSDVLLYLVPCGRVSVSDMQEMEGSDYEHFISSMLFAISFVLFASSSVLFTILPMLLAISTLAFLASGWTRFQRKVGN